jgi:DNA-binding transcriptional LysR family regulator
MQETNLRSVDLNLLVTLDALLSTRSATLAGKRLALSQPATSHALARLRELFGDRLLVRSGKALVPTPFAEQLAPRLRSVLELLGAVLHESSGFEPRTARRVFRIGTGDAEASVIAPSLTRYLAREAPYVDLFFKLVPTLDAEALGSGGLDLALGPPFLAAASAQLRSAELYRERFVCLIRKQHPLAQKRMTLDRFCACSHVLFAPRGSSARGMVDDALAELGRTRRVAVAVPHALTAPLLVAETDYVLTLPEGVARRLASVLGLRIIASPVELAGFSVAMHWHVRNDADPAHQFLRAALLQAARSR